MYFSIMGSEVVPTQHRRNKSAKLCLVISLFALGRLVLYVVCFVTNFRLCPFSLGICRNNLFQKLYLVSAGEILA